MTIDPKNDGRTRKNADAKGAARTRGKESAKRVLSEMKAPPPQGFPATAPGDPSPDERKPGTRKHGSPDRKELPDGPDDS